jgi:putative transposase
VPLVALFLDATFIGVRPDGPKEGVQVAWGFTEDGDRVLLAVSLGMRESFEDWQTLGRDLIGRGLAAPMLIVADGAPGLTKAIEQCWPASDRQRCWVHRARNLCARLPDRERERVKHACWQALDEAISEQDAKRRLRALVDDLDKAGSPPPPGAGPMTSTTLRRRSRRPHRLAPRSTGGQCCPVSAPPVGSIGSRPARGPGPDSRQKQDSPKARPTSMRTSPSTKWSASPRQLPGRGPVA